MLRRFLIGVLVLTALAGILSNIFAGETLINVSPATVEELQCITTVSDTTYYIYYEAKLDGNILTLKIDLSGGFTEISGVEVFLIH